MNDKTYVEFQLKEPWAPCSFLYPKDWGVQEVHEDGRMEIFIAGPKSRGGTSIIELLVRASMATDQTPDDAALAFISSHNSAFNCQVIGQATGTVAMKSAKEVEITYSMRLPVYHIHSQLTAIRERRIFIRFEDKMYEIVYRSPEEDYWIWFQACRVLMQTFTFADDFHGDTFRPLIT